MVESIELVARSWLLEKEQKEQEEERKFTEVESLNVRRDEYENANTLKMGWNEFGFSKVRK